ncbi:MAG: nicotinamide phosphoribosyltransferase domain-containing protein, partial [Cyanobacteria bacterium]|nr:nicotinamide phosphoribosyltransferase domain-containing protein [Cyanobacteriota bacterium]
MDYNLLLDTDSNKASHWLQYPPGTHYMFEYLESRGGDHPGVLFFGLQYLLREYLSKPIKPYMVDEAEEFFSLHGEPFNREGWMYIARTLGGKLPIIVKAVEEGSWIPNQNILMSVESTDPKVFWLPGYLETVFMRLWYPITVATHSFYLKQKIAEGLLITSDKPFAGIDYQLHDYGSRSVSSSESAAIGAMAHLVNFKGSDTTLGVRYANHYYDHEMAGFSIPGAEHST